MHHIKKAIKMKKSLAISFLLVGSFSAYSQGTVLFMDRQTDMNIHIYAPQTATPGVETTGQANSAEGVTADIYEQTAANGYTGAQVGVLVTGGRTVYTGGAIGNTAVGNATAAGAYHYNVGSDYSVELYGAAGYNQTLSSLAPLSQYTSQLSTSAIVGGTFVPVAFSDDPGIPNTTGNEATIALFVWYNVGGLTLAEDQAGAGPWGVSPTDNITGLGGLGSPASTPQDMLGLESFSLIAPATVPEPGTIALAVMGVSAFLFRRRKAV
jgi:hypothetical protein